MPFNVKIDGLENLQKALEGKQKEVEEVFMRDLNEGADTIIVSAKGRVHNISGHLSASINKNEVREKDGRMDIYVGIEKNEWFSKEDKYYPRFVEKGTSKMKARPYLRPALNENKAQIQSKIEEDLKEVIGTDGGNIQ
jgi:HK97 gp10 family phage protein